MSKGNAWGIVLGAAVGTGLLVGGGAFLAIGDGELPIKVKQETEQSKDDDDTVTASADTPETKTTETSAAKTEKETEPKTEAKQETEKAKEEEGEDEPDKHGTYVASGNGGISLYKGTTDGDEEALSATNMVYLDRVITKDDGTTWGHTSSAGYDGWIQTDEAVKVTDDDLSLEAGDKCFVINDYAGGIALKPEAGSGAAIATLKFGTELTVAGAEDGWIKTAYNGQTGYVDADYVAPEVTDLAYKLTLGSGGGTETFRAGASEDANSLGTIGNGDILKITDYEGGFGKATVNNVEGWVSMANMRPQEAGTEQNTPAANVSASGTQEVTVDPVQTAQAETQPQTQAQVQGYTDFYNDGTVVPYNDYIMRAAHERVLTRADLDRLTHKGVCYLKNEMYAVYGRKFKSSELQSYFNSQSWYTGLYEPEANDTGITYMMNSAEVQNKDILDQEDVARGWYQLQ